MLSSIFNEIFPVFIIILIGFKALKFKFLTESTADLLTKLVFYVVIPPTLFIEIATMQISFATYYKFMFSYCGSALILISIAFAISKFYFKRQHGELIINLMASSHANLVYLAIPIFLQVFNDAAPITAIITVQILFTVAFLLGLEKHQKTYVSFLKLICKNPLLIGILLGLSCNILSIKIPYFINYSCSTIKNSATFLSLFTLGASLATQHLSMKKHERSEIIFLIFSKSVMHPLVGYFMGKIFNLNNNQLYMLLLVCTMPSANNLFIFARQYNVGIERCNWIAFLTTCGSLVSIPIVIYLLYHS